MKMTPEHFAELSARVEALRPQIPVYRARLENCGSLIKDLDRRLLWDVYHACRVYDKYSYQDWDYTDEHIETAMRRILATTENAPIPVSIVERYEGSWEARPRNDGLMNIYVAGTEHDIALCVKPKDAPAFVALPKLLALLNKVAMDIEEIKPVDVFGSPEHMLASAAEIRALLKEAGS